MEAILLVPLGFLCWVAWQALHKAPPAVPEPLDLTRITEGLHEVAAAVRAVQIPEPVPTDLGPLVAVAEAFLAHQADVLTAGASDAALLRADLQAQAAAAQETFLVGLAQLVTVLETASQESRVATEELHAQLTPLASNICPRMDYLDQELEKLSVRVAVGPGKRTLSLP